MTQSIENLLNDVSLELKTLAMARQRYARQLAPDFSVFNYIYTDEMMLSRIIADLLNPQGDHAQGAAFLKLFISLLLDEELTHSLLLETADVSTEVQTLYIGKARRMDIYIKAKTIDSEQSFGLCIENKPFAADQKDQLQDYAVELAKRHSIKSKDDPYWHLVYLNRDGTDPSEYSVDNKTLEQWKHQGCFSNLNYPQLIEWLNQCKAVSQNPQVNTFLDAFSSYIMQTFSGFKDMSESHQIVDLILNNQNSLQSALAISNHMQQVKQQLMLTLFEQLQLECHPKSWKIKNMDLESGLIYSGFEIEFPHKLANYGIGFQYQKGNYAAAIIGVRKIDFKNSDTQLDQNIYQILSDSFPQVGKSSRHWAFYIELKYDVADQWVQIQQQQFHQHLGLISMFSTIEQGLTRLAEGTTPKEF